MVGVRVLEVAEHPFVPAASAVLADWGADVIKIEHAERGDAMRGLARTGVLDLSKGVHVLLEHANRGKRSIGMQFDGEFGRTRRAPGFNEHGEEILAELGFDRERVLELKSSGAIA